MYVGRMYVGRYAYVCLCIYVGRRRRRVCTKVCIHAGRDLCMSVCLSVCMEGVGYHGGYHGGRWPVDWIIYTCVCVCVVGVYVCAYAR